VIGTIVLLDREECIRLLATHCVGRIAVVDHGRPHVVPVNYTMDGDAVVFRTAVGTKLDAASRSAVAFEVDDLDRETREGWSVVVHGLAQEVTPYDRPDIVRRVRSLDPVPWATGDKPHVVRIAPHTVTGRRVRRPDPDPDR